MMLDRVHLAGSLLVAAAGAAIAGSAMVADSTPSSPRSLLLVAAGILLAVGEVLKVYAPSPPSTPA